MIEEKKVTLATLLDTVPAMNKLVALELNSIIAFRLYKFIEEINPILIGYDKLKAKVVEKYKLQELESEWKEKLQTNPDATREEIDKAIELAQQDLTQALQEEITVKAPMIALDDLKDVKLSVRDIQLIGFMIKE